MKLTKLTKLNCPRSCYHRKELLAQPGLHARKYSSCGTFSSRHASSFRRARIKIIFCYSKSIRAAINRCLSNALQIALSILTIGLAATLLQKKSFAPKFVRPQRSLLGANDLGVRASHEETSFTLPKVTRSIDLCS